MILVYEGSFQKRNANSQFWEANIGSYITKFMQCHQCCLLQLTFFLYQDFLNEGSIALICILSQGT